MSLMTVEVTTRPIRSEEATSYRGRVMAYTHMPVFIKDDWHDVPALLIERAETRELTVQPLMKEYTEIKVRRI